MCVSSDMYLSSDIYTTVVPDLLGAHAGRLHKRDVGAALVAIRCHARLHLDACEARLRSGLRTHILHKLMSVSDFFL